MILSDGVIGQMMEKVVLPPQKPRRTEEEVRKECPWAQWDVPLVVNQTSLPLWN